MLYFMYIQVKNYQVDMKLNVLNRKTDEHIAGP